MYSFQDDSSKSNTVALLKLLNAFVLNINYLSCDERFDDLLRESNFRCSHSLLLVELTVFHMDLFLFNRIPEVFENEMYACCP